uniref:Uncharacterized protein n=1 Tax=Physcomitrium patens TaxID=3218 RepID=A0A2K1KWB9_PHYPA|nr:hypothetical protein PHYPA_005066 [Physcomitrium patens]
MTKAFFLRLHTFLQSTLPPIHRGIYIRSQLGWRGSGASQVGYLLDSGFA